LGTGVQTYFAKDTVVAIKASDPQSATRYQIAKVLSCTSTNTEVQLYTTGNNGIWKITSSKTTVPLTHIIVSNFTLTKTGKLRASTQDQLFNHINFTNV
jgi:hypothetical protein